MVTVVCRSEGSARLEQFLKAGRQLVKDWVSGMRVQDGLKCPHRKIKELKSWLGFAVCFWECLCTGIK